MIELPGEGEFSEYIDHEDYYLGAMNRELDRDPSLRTATGLDVVTTCEEARHFALISNELVGTVEEGERALERSC